MKLKHIIGLLIVVAAIWAVWSLANPSETPPVNNDNNSNQQNNTPPRNDNDDDSEEPAPPGDVEEIPNALEGELQDSSDKRRGNYMLLLNDSDRIIYLNTSRDFSELVGKQVQVSIEGSLDDFRLLDITEK